MTSRRFFQLAAAAFAMAVPLVHVVKAHAATPTYSTTYYTINTTPVGAGTDWFLTADQYGHVTTQRYRPGNLYQQWTPVSTSFPDNDDLSGGPGITPDYDGPTSQKFLNRATGMCAVVRTHPGDSRDLIVAKCHQSSSRWNEATWMWSFRRSEQKTVVPSRYTILLQKIGGNQQGCMTLKSFSTTPGIGLRLGTCHRTVTADQAFRFLQVATVTCDYAHSYMRVCGTTPRL
jgi:hypothetical protein